MPDKKNDAYTQFEEWLSGQPYWLQDATFQIYSGKPINDTLINSYADFCISQSRDEKVTFKKLPEKGSITSGNNLTVSVLKLSKVENVNALAKDTSLEFSPTGITAVYGLNGAGKSGFMRIFKQLSNNPYEEPIQPNVYKAENGEKASCEFDILVDDSEDKIVCDLSSKSTETYLRYCDVFDTRISNAYITSPNNASYQPFVFTVLSELSIIASRISGVLNARRRDIDLGQIGIPKDYKDCEGVDWLLNLNSKSTIPKEYTSWSDDNQRAIDKLLSMLDEKQLATKYNLDKAHSNAIKPILDDIIKAKASFNRDEIIDAYAKIVKAKEKLEIAQKLFADSADEKDKISISLPEWRDLWAMAKKYYEKAIYTDGSLSFAEEKSICPLCHQTLSGDACTRFKHVNHFLNGKCSEEYEKALSSYETKVAVLVARNVSIANIKNNLVSIFSDAEIESVISVYTALSQIKECTDINKKHDLVLKLNFEPIQKALSSKFEEINKEMAELKDAINNDKRKENRLKLTELNYHKWVYEHKDSIQKAIDNLSFNAILESAIKLTATNKITLETNKLADALITEAYIERFNYELHKMAPRLKVVLKKAPSRRGNSPYRISLDSENGAKYKPEDILSEGEQRIVALAAFFADATGRNNNTPIIIDDPISSLDLNYEKNATERIVELAQTRQVIVFTHRISMLSGIKEMCEQYKVPNEERFIRGTSRGKGVPDFEDEYRGDLKKQLKAFGERIKELKSKDPDSHEYSDGIGRICQQFRICVERSVEEIFLFGMVHRFDRRIMTKGKIQKVLQITEDDCNIIDAMMTKYSFTEHSQPSDSPPIDVDIDELENDIAEFKKWTEEFKSRKK